jgi:hypothetical protein
VKRLTGDVAMMAMAGQLIGMTGGIENVGSPTMMEKDAIMEDMGEVVDEVEITAGNEMGHEAAVSQKEPDSFIRGVGAEPVNLSGPKPPQDSLVSINISEGLYKFTDPSTGKVTNIHLSPLEVEAVEKARVAGSTCSAHLADLGLIDVADTSRFHAALRRVALKIGLDVTPNHGWIGKLNKAISGASRTIQ